MVVGPVGEHEQAVGIDLGISWEPNVPSPTRLQSDLRAFLVLLIDAFEPRGDTLGIIEWKRCAATLLGGPNDEALAGHRLYDYSLADVTRAAEVRNSSWAASIEMANCVHPRHDPALFAGIKHFVLLLKDATFECLAESYSVETTSDSLDRVIARLVHRLFDPSGV